MVIRAVAAGYQAGIGQLVEIGLAYPYGKGLEGPVEFLGHEGHDHTRIHAPAQEGAHRHVAYQVPGHGFGQPGVDRLE
jgi:hypothetical protein